MKRTRFEEMVADGLKAKKMYAPVKTLSAREYESIKRRESKSPSRRNDNV